MGPEVRADAIVCMYRFGIGCALAWAVTVYGHSKCPTRVRGFKPKRFEKKSPCPSERVQVYETNVPSLR